MTDAHGVAAYAVLVVRLDGEAPSESALAWRRWYDVSDAAEDGFDAQAWRRPDQNSPHKQLPTENRLPYFTPNVQQLLFPRDPSSTTSGSHPTRWLCCPSDLWLDIGHERENCRRARIDLLERLLVPLAPLRSIGLIHLTLLSASNEDSEATLRWSNDLRQMFPQAAGPRFFLDGDLGEHSLQPRPYQALVKALFGDPHKDLERRLYSMIFAKEPSVPADALSENDVYLAGWRRALARGSRHAKDGERAEQRDPQKSAAQRASLGTVDAMVLGRGAAFTTPEQYFNGSYARSFRSYWSESLVFTLLQHERLEYFAARLAELGLDPSTESLDDLHMEWLAFRNVLWWSQIAMTTDVPQTLLNLLRAEYGTERLFSDLEGDFATYTAQRRWRVEGEQTRALANLQIY
jgi:hypothetical protein